MKKTRFSRWTSSISAIILLVSLFVSGLMPVQAADSSEFVDDFLNFDLTSSNNGVWEVWNNHIESGLSVVSRGQIAYPNYVTYKFADKVITGFSLGIQYYPDFCVPTSSLVISARTAGSTEWTVLNFSSTAPANIPGYETGNFKTSTITLTDAIPANTVEVKIELINDVAWTTFLDKLTLTTQAANVDDTLPEEEEPEEPVKEYDFTADMTDFDDVAEKSDNWEIHTPHSESLMNVYGKTNGKRGYVVYKKNGQYITDFAFDLMMAAAFFNKDAHLIVQVQTEGSDAWVDTAVAVSMPETVGNGVFSKSTVTPTAALPEKVTALKITLYNDVAWTLMLSDVKMDLKAAEVVTPPTDSTNPTDSTGTTKPSTNNPATGVATGTTALILVAAAAPTAFVFKRKFQK